MSSTVESPQLLDELWMRIIQLSEGKPAVALASVNKDTSRAVRGYLKIVKVFFKYFESLQLEFCEIRDAVSWDWRDGIKHINIPHKVFYLKTNPTGIQESLLFQDQEQLTTTVGLCERVLNHYFDKQKFSRIVELFQAGAFESLQTIPKNALLFEGADKFKEDPVKMAEHFPISYYNTERARAIGELVSTFHKILESDCFIKPIVGDFKPLVTVDQVIISKFKKAFEFTNKFPFSPIYYFGKIRSISILFNQNCSRKIELQHAVDLCNARLDTMFLIAQHSEVYDRKRQLAECQRANEAYQRELDSL